MSRYTITTARDPKTSNPKPVGMASDLQEALLIVSNMLNTAYVVWNMSGKVEAIIYDGEIYKREGEA
jgi:hypothetical protein